MCLAYLLVPRCRSRVPADANFQKSFSIKFILSADLICVISSVSSTNSQTYRHRRIPDDVDCDEGDKNEGEEVGQLGATQVHSVEHRDNC